MQKLIRTVILASLAVFTLFCAGCANRVIARPKEATPLPAISSQPADAACIFREYCENQALADVTYRGKRLIFTDLRVDAISRSGGNYYFESGNLRFRTTYPTDLDYLAEGTVVTVAGDCQGLIWNSIYFNSCWLDIVSGGLTAPRSGY
jgi:hypothetical protein